MAELPLDVPAIAELAGLRQWVCWRAVERDGKITKVPVQPSGINASTTNPHTWSSLEECQGAGFNGVGFVFTRALGIVGVDIDHCIEGDFFGDGATNGIDPEALGIVQRLRSYTEVSPSGRGLHILCRGVLPVDGGRRDPIEVYCHGRYFAMTGRHLGSTVDEIQDSQEALEWLWATKIRPGQSGPEPIRADVPLVPMPWVKFAALLANMPKFAATWGRQRKDLRDQSLSAYDASLAAQAFGCEWTAPEVRALLLEFRRSQGSDKADTRLDYLNRTIAQAERWVRAQRGDDVQFVKELAPDREQEEVNDRLNGHGDDRLDQARDFIRSELGVELSNVVLVNKPRPFFQMKINGIAIESCDQVELHTQPAFLRLVAGATGLVLRDVKKAVWLGVLRAIYSLAEEQTMDTLKGSKIALSVARGYLEAYEPIPEAALLEDESKGDLLLFNKPFRDGECLCFSLRDLMDRTKHNPEFPGHKILKLMLKERGFEPKDISGRLKSRALSNLRRDVVSRSYWVGPRAGLLG